MKISESGLLSFQSSTAVQKSACVYATLRSAGGIMPSKVCDVKMEEQISGLVGARVGARVGDEVGELVMTTAGCACTSIGVIVCTSSANSGLLTAFSIAAICSSSVAPPSVPDDTS